VGSADVCGFFTTPLPPEASFVEDSRDFIIDCRYNLCNLLHSLIIDYHVLSKWTRHNRCKKQLLLLGIIRSPVREYARRVARKLE
jgi:hypothetical protein